MAENMKVAKNLGKNDCEKRKFTVLRTEKILQNKEIKFKKMGLNKFRKMAGKCDRKQV